MSGHTKVGLITTRLPAGQRGRLRRLAQRGYEVCTKHRAPLLAQICDGLVLALQDLSAAECRLQVAARRIGDLERELSEFRRAEFADETTKTKEEPALIARCRTVG